MDNTSRQLAQYYQMLLAGGGTPIAMPQPQVQQGGNPLLEQLTRLFQQPQAGDGFNFNMVIPPTTNFLRAQQPRQVVNNRIY